MSDEEKDLLQNEELPTDESANEPTEHSDYTPVNRFDAAAVHHLSGMYQNWFLDYASYVILERAVPHIEDGLKPVQRLTFHRSPLSPFTPSTPSPVFTENTFRFH